MRQEFVANLVHELKTPITSLRLTAESLLGDPLPKDRRRFAERLVREADLMSKIIDNLRQLGDIETGVMAVDASDFDLAELIHDSVDPAGHRPHRQHFDSAEPGHLDRSSQARPGAWQPAGQRGQVLASWDRHRRQHRGQGDEVVLSVRDRGPGISPEHWSRVFERFYKVDRARPREAGGFGLGLAITKHLVQVLGGRIWTETARDGGQVFYIALPHQVLTGA